MRRAAAAILSVLILAGCAEEPVYMAGPRNLETQLVEPGQALQSFTYRHALQMEMDLDMVEPRFERARDACLEDAELDCVLIGAELNMSDDNYGARRYGVIGVTLPHDQVPAFEQRLLESVEGENPGDAIIVSRSTSAENVTKEAADIGLRVAQLTEYRDRLTELGRRADVGVDELIRIAGELSQTQRQLDEVLSQQADVSDRVQRERLNVTLYARAGMGDALRPLARVWDESVQILAANAAHAIRFVIGAIPWLPVFVAGFFLVSWLLRIVRRKIFGKATPRKQPEVPASA